MAERPDSEAGVLSDTELGIVHLLAAVIECGNLRMTVPPENLAEAQDDLLERRIEEIEARPESERPVKASMMLQALRDQLETDAS